MAYYVSAVKGRKRELVAGPWRRHGDALAHVRKVERWGNRRTKEGARGDVAWGTARHRAGHPAGRFNVELGLTPGPDGYLPPAPLRCTLNS